MVGIDPKIVCMLLIPATRMTPSCTLIVIVGANFITLLTLVMIDFENSLYKVIRKYKFSKAILKSFYHANHSKIVKWLQINTFFLFFLKLLIY